VTRSAANPSTLSALIAPPPSELTLAQFDYDLPEALIAQAPAPVRSASRLLHLDAAAQLHDRQFADVAQLLRAGDLLVFNDTRVIKARLHGYKASGGRVEILVERVLTPHTALAHVRASKSPKTGSTLLIHESGAKTDTCGVNGKTHHSQSHDPHGSGSPKAIRVTARHDALFELAFDEPVMTVLDACGQVPLPPYITHAPQNEDSERYQTVYAAHPGAVAAPTAGLHFDEALLARLRQQGVQQAFVTLHVGAGTFQPVRCENLREHVMHAEWFNVPSATLAAIRATRAASGRVIAVGTTSVRALESLPAESMALDAPACESPTQATSTNSALQGNTQLFITPGYRFRFIDALITNFHLPRSTLLVLVSALAGMDATQCAYAHAVAQRYRFFSYGDAMFIESPTTPLTIKTIQKHAHERSFL